MQWFTGFVYLFLCVSTRVQGQLFVDDHDTPLDQSDFVAMSNAVYDVGSRDSREVSSVPLHAQNSANYDAPFPQRITLKVEDGSSDFRACGGFSGGTTGTCCTACMKLNYKKGCWCRTWDCLCFDS